MDKGWLTRRRLLPGPAHRARQRRMGWRHAGGLRDRLRKLVRRGEPAAFVEAEGLLEDQSMARVISPADLGVDRRHKAGADADQFVPGQPLAAFDEGALLREGYFPLRGRRLGTRRTSTAHSTALC